MTLLEPNTSTDRESNKPIAHELLDPFLIDLSALLAFP